MYFYLGNGSTLQCIIDSINEGKLKANISLVVSNKEDAYGITRAKNAGIPTYIIKSNTKNEIDKELSEVLENYSFSLIVLAGYLKLIGENLIRKYTIINTHPSLIPKYCGFEMYGMKVHQAVVDNKETQTGVTLHYVNGEYDKGNIIAQTKVDVAQTDTAEDVSSKVQLAEKKQLIDTLIKFSNTI